MSEATTAVATPREETLGLYLQREDVQKKLFQALGNKANLGEFISNITMEVAKSDDLKQCSLASILQCAIDAANFGLVPNKTLGHAYLIPFNNKFKAANGQWTNRWEATLMIGYKGYVKKFGESNATVEVELVTKQEVETGRFREIRGSESKILHEPLRTGIRDKDNIALGYAIVRTPGREDIIVVMSIEEIMEAGKTQVWKDGKKISTHKGVWVTEGAARSTDFAEMCKKTLIRRAAKLTDIDVVTQMSSYEGKVEESLKDVTPAPAQSASFLQGFKAQYGAPQQLENAPSVNPIPVAPASEPVTVTRAKSNAAPKQLDLEEAIGLQKPVKEVIFYLPDGVRTYPTEFSAMGIVNAFDELFPGDRADVVKKNSDALKELAEIEKENKHAALAESILKVLG